MNIAADVTAFACPKCGTANAPGDDQRAVCLSCGWSGRAALFRPISLQVDEAESALPDDATCAHHPSKRAVAVCAGTGDYICSLCAIETQGGIYSASYLESAGKQTLRSFDQWLDRPDSTIATYIVCMFIPLINYIWMLGMPVWLPFGYYKLVKAFGQRNTNPIYARVVGVGRLIVLTILLALVTAVGFLLIIVALGEGFQQIGGN